MVSAIPRDRVATEIFCVIRVGEVSQQAQYNLYLYAMVNVHLYFQFVDIPFSICYDKKK